MGVEEKLAIALQALEFYTDRKKYRVSDISKYYPLVEDEGSVARTAITTIAESE